MPAVNLGDCCCGAPTTTPCSGCDLPLTDLALRVTYGGHFGALCASTAGDESLICDRPNDFGPGWLDCTWPAFQHTVSLPYAGTTVLLGHYWANTTCVTELTDGSLICANGTSSTCHNRKCKYIVYCNSSGLLRVCRYPFCMGDSCDSFVPPVSGSLGGAFCSGVTVASCSPLHFTGSHTPQGAAASLAYVLYDPTDPPPGFP
jgi:hypothetical protein